MLTFKVDANALVTYRQNGQDFPDQWPYSDKASAELHAQAICDKYNSKVENPDGIKYPNYIPTTEERLKNAGLVLPE
jgi:hypothetical protein